VKVWLDRADPLVTLKLAPVEVKDHAPGKRKNIFRQKSFCREISILKPTNL